MRIKHSADRVVRRTRSCLNVTQWPNAKKREGNECLARASSSRTWALCEVLCLWNSLKIPSMSDAIDKSKGASGQTASEAKTSELALRCVVDTSPGLRGVTRFDGHIDSLKQCWRENTSLSIDKKRWPSVAGSGRPQQMPEVIEHGLSFRASGRLGEKGSPL